jgi:hypothetical protein
VYSERGIVQLCRKPEVFLKNCIEHKIRVFIMLRVTIDVRTVVVTFVRLERKLELCRHILIKFSTKNFMEILSGFTGCLPWLTSPGIWICTVKLF